MSRKGFLTKLFFHTNYGHIKLLEKLLILFNRCVKNFFYFEIRFHFLYQLRPLYWGRKHKFMIFSNIHFWIKTLRIKSIIINLCQNKLNHKSQFVSCSRNFRKLTVPIKDHSISLKTIARDRSKNSIIDYKEKV